MQRHDEGPPIAPARFQGNREDPFHRPQLAGQRQLAADAEGLEIGHPVFFLQFQHPEGDRQIETWSLLSNICGRQVDRDAFPAGPAQCAVADGGGYPVFAFSDRRVGQADDRNFVDIPPPSVNFNLDLIRFDTDDSARIDLGRHH